MTSGADTQEVETIGLDLTGKRDEGEWQTLNIPDAAAADGIHPIRFHRPKIATIAVMEGVGASAVAMMQSVGTWMPHVFDAATYAYLDNRVGDDEDDFDLTHVVAIGNHLLGVWSEGRPTGRSNGSRRRSASTTRRSTGT